MFLHDLGVGLLRRWYLVLVGMLVTGFGAYSLMQVVPVTYEATSSVVLVPPATAVIEGENPYLYMGGLDQALSVLTVRLGSPTVADPILKKRADLNYSVDKDATTAGPIMLVGAEAGSEQETLTLLNQVVSVIPENLKLIQDQLNIPQDARITAMTIVSDTAAKEVNKKQMRAVLAGIAGGMAVTVLGAGLVDRFLIRRQGKKPKRSRVTDKSARKTAVGRRKAPKENSEQSDQSADGQLVADLSAISAATSTSRFERPANASQDDSDSGSTGDSMSDNLTTLSAKQ